MFMQHRFPMLMLIIILSSQGSIVPYLATDGCVKRWVELVSKKSTFEFSHLNMRPLHVCRRSSSDNSLLATSGPEIFAEAQRRSYSRGHTGKRCFIGGCNSQKFTVVTPSEKLSAQQMANVDPCGLAFDEKGREFERGPHIDPLIGVSCARTCSCCQKLPRHIKMGVLPDLASRDFCVFMPFQPHFAIHRTLCVTATRQNFLNTWLPSNTKTHTTHSTHNTTTTKHQHQHNTPHTTAPRTTTVILR